MTLDRCEKLLAEEKQENARLRYMVTSLQKTIYKLQCIISEDMRERMEQKKEDAQNDADDRALWAMMADHSECADGVRTVIR